MIWRAGPLLLVTASEDAASAVFDRSGAVTFYEPRTASDEDDLSRWKYVVVGGRCYERTTLETRGVCRHEDTLARERKAEDVALARAYRGLAANAHTATI